MAVQLLQGIGYMHANHVVHRDLKLENILIESSVTTMHLDQHIELLEVKISDFGLSKVLNDVGGHRHGQSAVGTPGYVAPEVLFEHYDERIDFWSFGVMLYAMLCGQMPFGSVRSLRPEQYKRSVTRSNLNECLPFQKLSDQGKDIILGLLTVNPDERLELDGCLAHPWIAESSMSPTTPLTQMVNPKTLPSTGQLGVVESLSGFADTAVRSLELQLRDGTQLAYPEAAMKRCLSGDNPAKGIDASNACVGLHTLQLFPDELIIGVMQDTFSVALGGAIVFYTSACRVLAFESKAARRRHRFVAPRHSQIIGMQFVGSQLSGIYLERLLSEQRGSVRQIRGWVGTSVDNVTFEFWDDSLQHYGDSGGGDIEQGPWELAPTETIVIVEQAFRENVLGASLAFYTSAGRILEFAGMTSSRSRRFAAPLGQQVCGLEFDENGLFVRAETCPEGGNLKRRHWYTVT